MLGELNDWFWAISFKHHGKHCRIRTIKDSGDTVAAVYYKDGICYGFIHYNDEKYGHPKTDHVQDKDLQVAMLKADIKLSELGYKINKLGF